MDVTTVPTTPDYNELPRFEENPEWIKTIFDVIETTPSTFLVIVIAGCALLYLVFSGKKR